MVMSEGVNQSDDSDLLVFVSQVQRNTEEIEDEKSKRGRASLSLYTPAHPGLNIDSTLWYHFIYYSDWLPQSYLACDYCALLRATAHWDRSIVFPSHVIKGWLGIAAHGCVLRPFYCLSFSCDKRMTVHCCAQLRIEAVPLFSFLM